MLAAAVATIAVELGAYLLARFGGASQRDATLSVLAMSVLWIALAGPVLAAGGTEAFSALLRGCVVADASLITLVVLWVSAGAPPPPRGPCVTLLGVVKIYCTYVAVSLAGVAAARCGRREAGRYVGAVIAAILFFVALASPFWIGGSLQAAQGPLRRWIITAAVDLNPFYSVTSAIVDQAHFVWHQAPVMYRFTRIGDFAAPPPVPWYAAAVVYGLLAGMLGATHLIRRGNRE